MAWSLPTSDIQKPSFRLQKSLMVIKGEGEAGFFSKIPVLSKFMSWWTWGQNFFEMKRKQKTWFIIARLLCERLWQLQVQQHRKLCPSAEITLLMLKTKPEAKQIAGILGVWRRGREGGRAGCCRRCSRALRKVDLPFTVFSPGFVLRDVSSSRSVMSPPCPASPGLLGCSVRQIEEVLWRKKPQKNKQFEKPGFVP